LQLCFYSGSPFLVCSALRLDFAKSFFYGYATGNQDSRFRPSRQADTFLRYPNPGALFFRLDIVAEFKSQLLMASLVRAYSVPSDTRLTPFPPPGKPPRQFGLRDSAGGRQFCVFWAVGQFFQPHRSILFRSFFLGTLFSFAGTGFFSPFPRRTPLIIPPILPVQLPGSFFSRVEPHVFF